MIQRDDMEWEVGGGFRIGNSCTPVVDSCQCMAKPIQYCKVKMKIKKNNKRNNIKILINIPKKILKKEKKYYQKEIQTQTHKELH